MRSSGARALSAVGFFFLIALTAACGGSKQEAKAPAGEPAADAVEVLRVGSSTPDPSSQSPTEAPKPAIVSAENGSDIVPPFTASKEPAKKASPTKGAKKAPGKPKKKANQKTARGAT